MIDNGSTHTISCGNIIITHMVEVRLPTEVGDFRLHLYEDEEGKQHLALVMGNVSGREDVMTRIHSECLTGDLFGSLRCDCQSQLHQSKEIIAEEGLGVIIYLRQEGRGIGLLSKLHSYNLQDEGFDTIEANTALGYQPDAREYDVASMILSDLGVQSIRLLSNNPDKLSSIGKGGIKVASMIAINPRVTKDNIRYLETKVERFHHLINVGANSYHSPEIEKLLRFVDRANALNGSRLPHITLFFNQTLNGLITDPRLSCELDTSNELAALRNRLRDKHQAMLVDAHSLDLSLKSGGSTDHLTIVFDRNLQGLERLGPSSLPNKLLVLAKEAPQQRRLALEVAGAEVVVLPKRANYRCIMSLLECRGIDSVIVEGSPPMLQRAMFDEHVDLVIGVISPHMPDGHPNNGWKARPSGHCLSFKEIHYLNIGSALVYYGIPSAPVEAR